jgi:hypothetical protein
VASVDIVVSEVTVTDGRRAGRVVTFCEFETYEALPGREQVTRPIDRLR